MKTLFVMMIAGLLYGAVQAALALQQAVSLSVSL